MIEYIRKCITFVHHVIRKEPHMWNTNYHVVVGENDMLNGKGYIRPGRLGSRTINYKYSLVAFSQVGVWLLNKHDHEYIRTFRSWHKRDQLVYKLNQFGIRIRRLTQNPCPIPAHY